MITRTVSVGVAVGMPGRDNTSDLLHRADEAVLTAKRAGGNSAAVSSDDMSLQRLFRNDIELHLRGEIDNDALLLHYLPRSICGPAQSWPSKRWSGGGIRRGGCCCRSRSSGWPNPPIWVGIWADG